MTSNKNEDELIRGQDNLDKMVSERASELLRLNDELKKEINERMLAEEKLEQRTKLLTTLLEISNFISSSMELQQLLESILDRLKEIIDYSGARIFILDGFELTLIAHRGGLNSGEVPDYSMNIKKSSFGEDVINNKKPMVIADLHGNTETAREFRYMMGDRFETTFKNVRSWMAIPLVIKDRVIGVLTVGHESTNFYQPQHISFGMAFANQAAIEFESIRLYNETVKKADEMKTMLAVQQAITSRLDKDAVLQMIADEARRLTNCERTAVFLVDGNDLVLSVFSGKDSRSFLGYRLPIGESLIGKSLMDAKPSTVNDTTSSTDIYRDLVEKAEVKSFHSIPLVAGNKPIGAITVVDKINGNFNQEDERILNLLASSAVIGLENSRLYEEEHKRHMVDEKRRRVAEGLRDILSVLNSNRPLQEVLDFMIGQAIKLLDTDTGALYRLKKDEGILVIDAAKGLPEEYINNMMVPLGMGVVGKAVIEKRPIIVPDLSVGMNSDLFKDPTRRPYLNWLSKNYKGLMALPLLCKNEIYGGIVLYYHELGNFSEEEIDLAEAFAEQVSLAIDNASLRAQAEEMAVAAERSRLARDLHDAVTQTLFSASLIAEVLPKIWEKSPVEGKKRLDEMKQLTKGALAEMRTLLLELRPSTLMESGLKELLTHLTQSVTGRSRIPVKLCMEGNAQLHPDTKIALYRIAQEALNNIAKHSGASEAEVEMKIYSNTSGDAVAAELVIIDNGKGFDISRVTPDHLGLGIMKERAEAIGAELDIEGRIGEGTRIVARWVLTDGGEIV